MLDDIRQLHFSDDCRGDRNGNNILAHKHYINDKCTKTSALTLVRPSNKSINLFGTR